MDKQKMALLVEQSVELVEIFLNCEFESLNISDISNYQLRNSPDSRLLWQCLQRQRPLPAAAAPQPCSPGQIVNCFLQARRTCLRRSVRMVKTIRFRGAAARRILARQPDLKILYLVRDPRGTITSQKNVFQVFKWENVSDFSRDYCQVFREDLAVMGQLLDEYPGRVRMLRYEALALSPMEASERFYAFLGLNFSQEVQTFIYNKTMAGQQSKNPYQTQRSNSWETAYSWRAKIALKAAQTIDGNCRDVYDALGYIPVNSEEELTDSAHSLLKPAMFHGRQL